MFPKSITLITLGVADLARSRAFYAALGWEAAVGAGRASSSSSSPARCWRSSGSTTSPPTCTPTAARLGTGAATLARNFATEARGRRRLRPRRRGGGARAQAAGEGRSGAATRAISPTPTATSGRWR